MLKIQENASGGIALAAILSMEMIA